MATVQPFVGGFSPLDVLSVLMIFGPAYLANTGAMLFGKWIPEKTGMPKWRIDGGRVWRDGFRILGDGKSWNGLFGGALSSGILMMAAHLIWAGRETISKRPFIDPLASATASDWFWIGNEWVAAFIMGFVLGFFCLVGDSIGSFVKRRRGLKREGDVSSKAPLLDTLPFAILIFIAGLVLFPGQIVGQTVLIPSMLALLVLTPLIHRGVNILGYKLGLKEVPY